MNARTPLPAEFSEDPFTFATARAAGVSQSRMRGADLESPFHGVRRVRSEQHDVDSLCRSYLTKLPQRAFFSSVTAAQLYGIPLPSRVTNSPRIHVAIESPHRGLEGRGVIGHKVKLMGDDVRQWKGLPVSSPERVWCELGRVLSVFELVVAGDHLINWRAPLTSTESLRDAVRRFPDPRGRARLRTAPALFDSRSESPKESEVRVLLHYAGFSGLVANHPVRIGSKNHRIDLALPEYKVAIEYQSDYHRDPHQFRADMTRISRLESDGWFVIQINADDLRDPRELVERIRRVLIARPFSPRGGI